MEENENLQEPINEQVNEVAEEKQPKVKSKKKIAALVISFILGALALVATFYCVDMYIGNLNLMNAEDLSGLAIIITLPLFLLFGIIELGLGLTTFIFSIITLVKFKIKNPGYIIYVVLMGLVTLFPIVSFITIVAHSGSSSDTSSISSISSI